MYTIVKADVTEPKDVTLRHSNVITIWQTSAIEMTALLNSGLAKTLNFCYRTAEC